MREERVHRIEVHVAGICFQGDRILAAKRSGSRKLYPNLWECGGGQVETGENLEEAVKRQLEQELGVMIEPVRVLGTYEINVPDSEQKKIPGIKFVCKIKGFVNGKEPQISQEHSEWRWVSPEELDELEFIPGVKEEIRDAHSAYRGIQ